jgi:hypothetical protein
MQDDLGASYKICFTSGHESHTSGFAYSKKIFFNVLVLSI